MTSTQSQAQNQDRLITSARDFTKSLEGKIYRLAPMPNFKHHLNALIALCVSQQYEGVTTATAHYLRAKSLNSYTVKIPKAADGFGYIEPVLYPGEKIQKIQLFVNDSCAVSINYPEGNKIYLYPDTYIPATLFSYMPVEIEVTIANMMYSTEKRLVWIDGLYLQPKERDTFFRLATDVTAQVFPELQANSEETEENIDIEANSNSDSSYDSGLNPSAEKTAEKVLQCPICSEYSIFLDRGLCPQGHSFSITF